MIFETEKALCQAFILGVPADWIAYPETCGWDILLVHRHGGWQIGVEAKLTLNAKVLEQAIRGRDKGYPGPDFRAVLVGRVVAENATLAHALGLTVIKPKPDPRELDWGSWTHAPRPVQGPRIPGFHPDLPKAATLVRMDTYWATWDRDDAWLDQFPTERHALPDYVPEVSAGVPSPIILSAWKIKAIRVCVWVERHGIITRHHFKKLGLDPSRWMTGHWLKGGANRGEWVAGPHFPAAQLRREHPGVFAQVEADYGQWSQKVAP